MLSDVEVRKVNEIQKIKSFLSTIVWVDFLQHYLDHATLKNEKLKSNALDNSQPVLVMHDKWLDINSTTTTIR